MKIYNLLDKKKEKLIKQYIVDNKDSLYRFAYSYTKNQNDALDIVHDAICKALANKKSLKSEDKIKPWIYQIISNCAIDYMRKNNKYTEMTDEIQNDSMVGFDEYENFDLQRAMQLLPEKYKRVIILRYFEDMKISEITEVLGENESTIKTRLYTGLSKLKIELTKIEEV